MSKVGQIERVTQNRIVQLFREKLGYAYRHPFGKYQFDPLSVFMEKKLV